MLCQRCGSEMYDGNTCPECGTARKLPLSGCLDPDTVYEIRSIKPAAPAQPGAAPSGRPKPRPIHREWDIAVPVLKAPANSGTGGAGRVMTKAASLITGALMVLALGACVISICLDMDKPQTAYAPVYAVEASDNIK